MTFEEWLEQEYGSTHDLTLTEVSRLELAWNAGYEQGIIDEYVEGKNEDGRL